jgi:hypothetical protein
MEPGTLYPETVLSVQMFPTFFYCKGKKSHKDGPNLTGL